MSRAKIYMICALVILGAIAVALGIIENNRHLHSTTNNRQAQIQAAQERYRKAVADHRYIMHALGGIDKTHTFTNSIDALERAYKEGERLFEVDISTTTDGELVLAHCNDDGAYVDDGQMNTWNKNDWEKRLGQTYNPEHPLASYEEFMHFQIQGKYRATDFQMLLDFAREHEDTYYTIDVGNRSYEATKEIYTLIVEAAERDSSILDRFNVGGQSTEMVRAEKDVYDFPIMYLYYGADAVRESIVFTPEAFLLYCEEQGIMCYATSRKIYEKSDLEILIKSDKVGFVYTIDDENVADNILQDGIDCIGTNFLR